MAPEYIFEQLNELTDFAAPKTLYNYNSRDSNSNNENHVNSIKIDD